MLYKLSILQILRYCWKTDLENSQSCAITKGVKESSNRYSFQVISLQKNGTKHIHNCIIYSNDKDYEGNLYNCKAIMTSCDCERYKYTFETSQALRNASEIIYSSGELPYIKNPQFKISVCKHLLKCMLYILINKL